MGITSVYAASCVDPERAPELNCALDRYKNNMDHCDPDDRDCDNPIWVDVEECSFDNFDCDKPEWQVTDYCVLENWDCTELPWENTEECSIEYLDCTDPKWRNLENCYAENVDCGKPEWQSLSACIEDVVQPDTSLEDASGDVSDVYSGDLGPELPEDIGPEVEPDAPYDVAESEDIGLDVEPDVEVGEPDVQLDIGYDGEADGMYDDTSDTDVGPDVEEGCTYEDMFILPGGIKEIGCGGINGNAIKTIECKDMGGSYEIKTIEACADPDECSYDAEPIQKSCSTDVGECVEGLENYLCEGVPAKWIPQGSCSGITPKSEDLNDNFSCDVVDLDGRDNDCDGVIDNICDLFIETNQIDDTPKKYNVGCKPGFNPNCSSFNESYVAEVDSFSIDAFEVTMGQYIECVNQGVCQVPMDLSSFTFPDYFGNPEHVDKPVVNVTWEQARIYCVFAGGIQDELNVVEENPFEYGLFTSDLPTEAQWEIAARDDPSSDSQNSHPLYPFEGGPEGKANYGGFYGDLVEVGFFPEGISKNGVYDLAGNAMEFVFNAHSVNPSGFAANDIGFDNDDGTKTRKDGTFLHPSSDIFIFMKNQASTGFYNFATGFRCARNDGFLE